MPLSNFSKSHFHFPVEFWHGDSLKISERASLYITNSVRVLAIGLIGIFLPLYLFENSKSVLFFCDNQLLNGMLWVVLYFGLRSLFTIITILVFGKIIFSKLHFQISMILSFILLVIEIYLWTLIGTNIIYLVLAGILSGIVTALYWVPYHIFFVKKSGGNIKHFGQKVGIRHFLDKIFSSFAPLIGGVIIAKFGYNNLFIVISLCLLFASFPLAIVVHEWKHHDHNMFKIFKSYILSRKYLKFTLAFGGEGAELVIYTIFWPILMYLVIKNYVEIGFVNTVSLVLSSFTILYVGKLADKKGTKAIHKIGVILNSLFYIPRIFIKNYFVIFSLDVFDRFNSSMYGLPLMAKTYEKAKEIDPSEFIIFREYSLHLGIVIMSFLIFGLFYLTGRWELVFIFAAVGSLMTYLIELDKN